MPEPTATNIGTIIDLVNLRESGRGREGVARKLELEKYLVALKDAGLAIQKDELRARLAEIQRSKIEYTQASRIFIRTTGDSTLVALTPIVLQPPPPMEQRTVPEVVIHFPPNPLDYLAEFKRAQSHGLHVTLRHRTTLTGAVMIESLGVFSREG